MVKRTLAGSGEPDLDFQKEQKALAERAEQQRGDIHTVADFLLENVIAEDGDGLVFTHAKLLADRLPDLDALLDRMPPGLRADVSLVFRDILRAANWLARYAPPVPEIASKVSSKNASAAGSASGKARKEKARREWGNHALELAKEARSANPSLSQDGVVYFICDHWKMVAKTPGHKTLKDAVCGWEKSGVLHKRVGK